MQYKTNYRVYDRFVITNDIELYDLILGDFSPKIKWWKFEDRNEVRIDFTVKKMQLMQIKGKGQQHEGTNNKPIKLFQEYMDKRETMRLREIETSTTNEDGEYTFDVVVDKRYFPRYYTVLIKI